MKRGMLPPAHIHLSEKKSMLSQVRKKKETEKKGALFSCFVPHAGENSERNKIRSIESIFIDDFSSLTNSKWRLETVD